MMPSRVTIRGKSDLIDHESSMPTAIPGLLWMQSVLDLVARTLLYLLPVLLVAGRAPADIGMSLIGLLFLIRSALVWQWQWLKTPWVVAGLGFWLYLLLVSELAISPDDSYSRALPFLRFVIFAAAMQHCLLIDHKSVRIFLSILAATVGFVIADCLFQYVMGHDVFGKVAEGQFRLSGPFNKDVAGTFIAKTSLVLLGWWFTWSASRGHLSWLVGGLLAALVGVTIMLTGERTALVTYGLGVFLVAMSVREVRLPLLLMGLLVAAGLGSAIATDHHLKERFVSHTISDVDDFWTDRYGVIFVKAFEVWQKQPLVGVGLKNFRLACDTANFEHRGPIETWCFTHPHNPYMELLAEAGIIGLLIFLVLFGLISRDLASGWQRSRTDFPLIVAASFALVLFLWPVMVSPSIFSNWNGMLLWLSVGLALSLARPRLKQPRSVKESSQA